MNRIQWRITIPYLILILVLMGSVSGFLIYSVRQNYIINLENELIINGKVLATGLEGFISDQANLDELNQGVKKWAELSNYRFTIISNDGTVIGESHENPSEMDNHADRPEVIDARKNGQGVSIRYSDTVKYQMMYAAVPVTSNGDVIGFLRIAVPLRSIQANLKSALQILIIITVIAIVIAMILAWWIAAKVTQPLRQLTESAIDISKRARDGERITEPIEPVTLDEVGDLTYAINMMTGQLQAELDKLETERMKIAAVLGEMTDGVIIVDDQGTIQLINPAAEGMFDFNGKKPIGLSLVEVVRNYQIIEAWQKSRALDKSEINSLEIGAKHLFLQVVVTPLDPVLPGNSLILLQNITQIRRLETVRRDFISNISHELRTPLAALKALTETLQEGALDDPPAAHRFLQKIETEVDALSLMVSELLELARIESGRVPLNIEPTYPCQIMINAIERLFLQAERAGLEIKTNCPDELPNVLADISRMEQVLVNLLHNAIKFTPSGGKIYVSADEKGDYIQFSVRDTGIGIPKADLTRIFERFYKTDPARAGSGTGLGLAISRHLVNAHHGRIWAESIQGEGSTFYFTIPKS